MKIGMTVARLILPYMAGAVGAFAASEYTSMFDAFCKGGI